MRLLNAFLASVLAGATLAPQISDACCGPYAYNPAPRMLMVSSHSAQAKGNKWTNRSFVVLEQSFDAQANGEWIQLAPMSFDRAQVMALPALETPMELTLVGPAGTRTVKAKKQFALTGDFKIGHQQKRLVLELDTPASSFAIALVGKVDAKWTELDFQDGKTSIKGTDMQIVEEYRDGYTSVTVRQNGRDIAYGSGDAIGVVEVKGRTFLVTNSRGYLGTVQLPALSIAKA